ncbi:MAG: hypothetical protein QM528_07455 [Phycisphaerales bacterium]|nr:hypothetical protein [Phycisphaerales bacterium]
MKKNMVDQLGTTLKRADLKKAEMQIVMGGKCTWHEALSCTLCITSCLAVPIKERVACDEGCYRSTGCSQQDCQ